MVDRYNVTANTLTDSMGSWKPLIRNTHGRNDSLVPQEILDLVSQISGNIKRDFEMTIEKLHQAETNYLSWDTGTPIQARP